MSKIRAAIKGVHGYAPNYVMTNEELEALVDTNDEWITTRTGIKERRILKGEGQGTSIICIEAAKGVLKKTKVDPKDVDLVIVATITPDMTFPATSNLVAAAIGADNAFGYDMGAGCCGFIYSLSTGAQFIESGRYKNVLVISADKMSSIIDYSDRSTCIIFGDGGGAVLLQPSEDDNGIVDFMHKSYGHGAQYLNVKAGGSSYPATLNTLNAKEHYVRQEGATVFKFAVKNMADYAEKIMKRNGLDSDDVQWLAPHQANKRIIDATASKMGISEEKVMMNIEKYGNTTSGTIPLLLWDYESRLKKGDNVILAAFGGGFSWGSVYLRWSYDSE